jgi:hypothetical protein
LHALLVKKQKPANGTGLKKAEFIPDENRLQVAAGQEFSASARACESGNGEIVPIRKNPQASGNTDSAFHNNLKFDSQSWGYLEKLILSHSSTLARRVRA